MDKSLAREILFSALHRRAENCCLNRSDQNQLYGFWPVGSNYRDIVHTWSLLADLSTSNIVIRYERLRHGKRWWDGEYDRHQDESGF